MTIEDFETRIAGALAVARSEEDRFNAQAAAASTPTRRLALGMKGASYNAVRVVLEELLQPGYHSAEQAPPGEPPFAGELADAPPHPEEPRSSDGEGQS